MSDHRFSHLSPPAVGYVVRRHVKRTAVLPVLVALSVIALAACGSSSSSQSTGNSPTKTVTSVEAGQNVVTGGANIRGKTVLFLSHSTPDDTFFVPAINGAKAAAALMGLKVDVQYGNNDDSTTTSIVNTAMANGVNALDLSVQDSALNKDICQAVAKGVPVVAYNSNGATGSGEKCLPAYIGQDFVASGALIAEKLLATSNVKSGDSAFCPVEYPAQSYAVDREKGAQEVLKAHGITCAELGTGVQPGQAKAAEVNYLLGHRNTAAILGLGQDALEAAVAAAKQLNLKVPIVGFDLSPSILTSIKSGAIIATVDQQPYQQGFLSVMELALQMKYGLQPASINTSNGALITKSNVDAVTSLVPNYR
jgi:simple sugar transport system substrate-binding protein